MTIQTVSPFLFPTFVEVNTQSTAVATGMGTAFTFDGSADRLALITFIPKTGTLTGVTFRTGTVSTAGATFQIQIEGVDGSGNPDGAAKYTNANGTVSVATVDDNLWKLVSLNSGTGVSVTQGDLVAIVLSVSSGTPNTVIIANAPGQINGYVMGNFPYLVEDTGGGTYARSTINTNTLCLVLNYGATIERVLGGSPTDGAAITTIGNDAERGMRFQLPVPMRAYGARMRFANQAAGSNFRVRIYSGTTTILADSGVIDGDVTQATTRDNYFDVVFPATVDLAASTTYYLTVWQTTANNLLLAESTVSSTDYLNAYPGGGQFYLANRAAGGTGSWTETTATRPDMGLWVNGLDDGAGGGGTTIAGTTLMRGVANGA